MLSTYHNSKTGSDVTLRVNADRDAREITVEVSVHDCVKHTYQKYTFAADEFGQAIDLYESVMRQMDAE